LEHELVPINWILDRTARQIHRVSSGVRIDHDVILIGGFMNDRNTKLRCLSVLFLLFSFLVLNHHLFTQEMIENGSFNSDEGWTVYNMGGNTPSEAVFAVDDGLGPAAGNGPYLFLTGEDTYTNILVWRVLTLEADKTYQYSGVYLYHLKVGQSSETRRMIYLK